MGFIQNNFLKRKKGSFYMIEKKRNLLNLRKKDKKKN